jgi:transposase-like protein
MAVASVHCPTCQSTEVVNYGTMPAGTQRFYGHHPAGDRQTLLVAYLNQGFLPEVKRQIVDMALHGRGMRETARVWGSSPTTVMETFTKQHLSSQS